MLNVVAFLLLVAPLRAMEIHDPLDFECCHVAQPTTPARHSYRITIVPPADLRPHVLDHMDDVDRFQTYVGVTRAAYGNPYRAFAAKPLQLIYAEALAAQLQSLGHDVHIAQDAAPAPGTPALEPAQLGRLDTGGAMADLIVHGTLLDWRFDGSSVGSRKLLTEVQLVAVAPGTSSPRWEGTVACQVHRKDEASVLFAGAEDSAKDLAKEWYGGRKVRQMITALLEVSLVEHIYMLVEPGGPGESFFADGASFPAESVLALPGVPATRTAAPVRAAPEPPPPEVLQTVPEPPPPEVLQTVPEPPPPEPEPALVAPEPEPEVLQTVPEPAPPEPEVLQTVPEPVAVAPVPEPEPEPPPVATPEPAVAHVGPSPEPVYVNDAGPCSSANPAGCYQMGVQVFSGLGFPQDPEYAARLFERACKGGHSLACVELASMTWSGLGVSRDKEGAGRLYRDACEDGDPWACHSMAWLRFHGDGVRRDVIEACELWDRACASGVLEACSAVEESGACR